MTPGLRWRLQAASTWSALEIAPRECERECGEPAITGWTWVTPGPDGWWIAAVADRRGRVVGYEHHETREAADAWAFAEAQKLGFWGDQ